ncbi:MAG: ABC transporter ATP-binding protein [Clostridiaceae bacterium]|nr:ABC transporter ATP-binding protein [Clostridiaceae bacterium]
MLKLFRNLTRRDWFLAGCSVVFIVVQVWLDLKLPDYMSEITLRVQTEGSAMRDILTAGGKMLACALGSLCAAVIVAIFAARLASNFGASLRSKLFDRVQSFSLEEIGSFSTASLITRSTNDVTQVQMLIVMGFQVIVKAPIMAIWAITKIAGKSSQWTMSTGTAVVLLVAIVGACVYFTMPRFKRIQKLIDDLNRVTRENLTGLAVVRAYNAEDYQESKFDAANDDLTRTNLFTNRVMSILFPTINIVMSGLTLSIFWIGAFLIDQAAMPDKFTLFSDMVVYTSYAMQIVMSVMMLIIIFIILPRASVSGRRILQVLEKKPSILDGGIRESADGQKGEIEFRGVSFRYPDAEEYVLENISFTAHRGETVAFIGSTGCGKSTVINLIPRFYDVTEGSVLVDGVDVREYSQAALRDRIGYVSQRAVLFSGTVRSNVAYGDNGHAEVSEEDVVNAVYTAQAADFVEKLEDGYDGFIAQGGANLSGGQKQRLSIARAIARRPEIFIFDDSFSALDYKTDRVLREALKRECRDATKLIVAQRIGTIRDADRIVVLDDGHVAGIGTHTELMKNCEVYREIAYSQLSKEELD